MIKLNDILSEIRIKPILPLIKGKKYIFPNITNKYNKHIIGAYIGEEDGIHKFKEWDGTIIWVGDDELMKRFFEKGEIKLYNG